MIKITPAKAFAAAIALSSFFLFLIQPLISQAMLPWFGGGIVVWATALVFFQTVLLAGYLYAHLLTRFSTKNQTIIHGALIVAAIIALPILPGASLKPLADAAPTTGVLYVLLMSIGLPYFLLCSTTPLLQSWFARLPDSGSPYPFYSLSNAASFAALFAYPFLLQPALTLPHQSLVFSLGLIATGAALAYAAYVVATRGRPAFADRESSSFRLSWRNALLWTTLAAIGSALFLGVTNQLTLDIAPTPFLWVLPLAIYLLSFILAFGDSFWYNRSFTAIVFGGSLLISLLISTAPRGWPITVTVTSALVMLLSGCLLCHGELVKRKPPVTGLTWFYFFLSLGGAIGGTFVAIIAPRIFSGYWELPLTEIACLVIALRVTVFHRGSKHWILKRPITALGALGLLVAIGFSYLTLFATFYRDTIFVKRTPYGILRVKEYDAGTKDAFRELLNGSTTHGNQYLSEALRRQPTTYYGPSSGIGKLMASYSTETPRRLGVIGLGTGTLAAYDDFNDSMTFYEIDPAVEAMNRQEFSYLADATGKVNVVLGDARLSLESESPQQFDVLAIDAFASDAIPVHLLTKEAFEEYARHMKDGGTIAVHISNRHLDLAPIVIAGANEIGFSWREIITDTIGEHEANSDWILLSKDENRLMSIKKAQDPRAALLWTDSYSSLWPILRF